MQAKPDSRGAMSQGSVYRRSLLRMLALGGLGAAGLSLSQACTPATPAAPSTAVPQPATATQPPPPTVAPTAAATAVSANVTATSAPQVRPTVAPATGRRGGTITFGTAQDFPGLDPHLVPLLNAKNLNTVLWSGLTRYNDVMEVQPDLAERWESPDPKTFVFYVRKGARFHNGREITADDVKWSIGRVVDPETKSPWRSAVDKIGSIDVVDQYTVKLNLTQANVIQAGELTDIKILPKETVAQATTSPVGSGPFQFVEFVPGDHLTLKRFDGYWDQPKPYPDQFVIKIVKDDTALYNAFKAGQLDILWQLRFEDNAEVASNKNQWIINPKFSGNSMILQVDTRHEPFNNKLARQALRYALDVDSVFELAYFKLGWPSFANSSLVTNHWAYNPNLAPYPYDPDKARELFKEAGVKDGYTIRYNAISGLWRAWIVQAEILDRTLKPMGINLDIRPVDLSEWVANIRGKDYPNLINPNGNERAWDPAEQLKGYRCNETRASVFYCNDEVNALMDQGLAETDQEKRKQIYWKVQDIVHEDVPWVTTHHRPLNHAAWNYVKGVFVDAQGDLHMEGISTEK